MKVNNPLLRSDLVFFINKRNPTAAEHRLDHFLTKGTILVDISIYRHSSPVTAKPPLMATVRMSEETAEVSSIATIMALVEQQIAIDIAEINGEGIAYENAPDDPEILKMRELLGIT